MSNNNNIIKEVPIMPEEYKSGITYHIPKGRSTTVGEEGLISTRWTKEEEEWCWKLYKEGYKYKDIAKSIGRPFNSVSIKMKRLKKKHNEYNEAHIEDKHITNDLYMEYMNNKYGDNTILDVFCGCNKYYSTRGYNVVENDIDTSIEADYNMDATKLLSKLVSENEKFDIVDLDPFGASITYLEDSLKIANVGLVMTFGELGHKRWKRLDFISKYYNINTVEDITLTNFVDNVIIKAKELGYILKPIYTRDYGNIGRVWFEVYRIL